MDLRILANEEVPFPHPSRQTQKIHQGPFHQDLLTDEKGHNVGNMAVTDENFRPSVISCDINAKNPVQQLNRIALIVMPNLLELLLVMATWNTESANPEGLQIILETLMISATKET